MKKRKTFSSVLTMLLCFLSSAQDKPSTTVVAVGAPVSQKFVMTCCKSSLDLKSEPLIIIDGVPATKAVFSKIEPDTIESVTVLKGAGATAIFGIRGKYGVIVVKTKEQYLTYEEIVNLNSSKPKAKLRDSAFVRYRPLNQKQSQ